MPLRFLCHFKALLPLLILCLLTGITPETQAARELTIHGDIPTSWATKEASCTPERRWKSPNKTIYPRSPLIVDKGWLYTSSEVLYAMDTKTGDVKWQFKINSNFHEQFASDGVTVLKLEGDVLYMAAYTGMVYAFDRYTGAIRWQRDVGEDHRAKGWRYGLKEVMNSSADTIYVHNSRQVYAINKKDGSIRWKMEGEDFSKEDLVFVTSTYDPRTQQLFVLDRNAVYALNAKTGKLVWTFAPPPDPENPDRRRFTETLTFFVYQDMVFAGKNITVKDSKNIFYGLSVKDGSIKQEFRFLGLYPNGPVQQVGDKLLLNSNISEVTLFDPKTDQSEWWFNPSSGGSRPPFIYKNLVVVGAGNRNIHIVDLKTGDEIARMLMPRNQSKDDDVVSIRSLWVDDSGLYFLGRDRAVHAYEFDCPQFKDRPEFKQKK